MIFTNPITGKLSSDEIDYTSCSCHTVGRWERWEHCAIQSYATIWARSFAYDEENAWQIYVIRNPTCIGCEASIVLRTCSDLLRSQRWWTIKDSCFCYNCQAYGCCFKCLNAEILTCTDWFSGLCISQCDYNTHQQGLEHDKIVNYRVKLNPDPLRWNATTASSNPLGPSLHTEVEKQRLMSTRFDNANNNHFQLSLPPAFSAIFHFLLIYSREF